MQKPIEQSGVENLFSKLKNNFSDFVEFETKTDDFKILSQMPAKQISHFAKQSVHNQTPITVQINTEDEVIESSGVPIISNKSGHLIIKEKSSNVYQLVKANTIRHIRKY